MGRPSGKGSWGLPPLVGCADRARAAWSRNQTCPKITPTPRLLGNFNRTLRWSGRVAHDVAAGAPPHVRDSRGPGDLREEGGEGVLSGHVVAGFANESVPIAVVN